MELPIQLTFFKKLDLYQTLVVENKKAKGTSWQDWEMEKDFLAWTARGHHHLGVPIKSSRYQYEIYKTGKYAGNMPYETSMENLVIRGFANHPYYPSEDILVTKEGLLMGKVIDEVEKGNFYQRLKYPLFINGTWLAVILAFIILLRNAVDALSPILNPAIIFICKRI